MTDLRNDFLVVAPFVAQHIPGARTVRVALKKGDRVRITVTLRGRRKALIAEGSDVKDALRALIEANNRLVDEIAATKGNSP